MSKRYIIRGRAYGNRELPTRFLYTLTDTVTGKDVMQSFGSHPFNAPAFMSKRQAQLNTAAVLDHAYDNVMRKHNQVR